jgi:transposase
MSLWLPRVILGPRQETLPRSLLGKACSYRIDHWEQHTAHLQYSQLRLDNNLVENAIPTPGQRSAVIYSLLVSCQCHGKDPLA